MRKILDALRADKAHVICENVLTYSGSYTNIIGIVPDNNVIDLTVSINCFIPVNDKFIINTKKMFWIDEESYHGNIPINGIINWTNCI